MYGVLLMYFLSSQVVLLKFTIFSMKFILQLIFLFAREYPWIFYKVTNFEKQQKVILGLS
jgi:hypothetical protein